MQFWKMNGAGNDFIILDGIKEKIDPAKAPELARLLCERHLSIGADGLMLVLPAETPEADYRMLFFNADGSLGEMCGNGARCICRYGYENRYAGEIQRVQTTAGLVTGKRIDERNYRIRLNDPSMVNLHRVVTVDDVEFLCSYVELGNPGLPHVVIELPTKYKKAVCALLRNKTACPLEKSEQQKPSPGSEAGNTEEAEKTADQEQLLNELRELGRKLRYHPAFPKGANINFCCLTGENRLDIITFERGVEDFTYACGTGTGSAALVLSRLGRTGNADVQITNRGGLLRVDVTEEGLYLTGPTNIVAVGEIRDEEFSAAFTDD